MGLGNLSAARAGFRVLTDGDIPLSDRKCSWAEMCIKLYHWMPVIACPPESHHSYASALSWVHHNPGEENPLQVSALGRTFLNMMLSVDGVGELKEERHIAQVDGVECDSLVTRPSTTHQPCPAMVGSLSAKSHITPAPVLAGVEAILGHWERPAPPAFTAKLLLVALIIPMPISHGISSQSRPRLISKPVPNPKPNITHHPPAPSP